MSEQKRWGKLLIFCNGHRVREIFIYFLIHPFKSRNRIVVFVTAIDIGNPLIVTTRIIKVEHRGDSIDSNTINMELFEPVQGIGDQEAANVLTA